MFSTEELDDVSYDGSALFNNAGFNNDFAEEHIVLIRGLQVSSNS